MGTTSIISNERGWTFRDHRGNEGPMNVHSIEQDPNTGRVRTNFESGWTLSVDPNKPDVGATIISPNGRENTATVIREKGGYVVPAPSFSTAPNMGSSFNAATTVTAESLGMGQKDFTRLMERQRDWEGAVESGAHYSKQSPVFERQLKLQMYRNQLGMGAAEFDSLLRRQSEHMSLAERAMAGEDVGAMPRTSPLDAALNAKKMEESTGMGNNYLRPRGFGQ